LLGKSHRKFMSLRVNLFRASETLLRKLRMCTACQEVSAYYRNSNSYVLAYLLIVNVLVALRHSRLATGAMTPPGECTRHYSPSNPSARAV
jgi:hypothetical protein